MIPLFVDCTGRRIVIFGGGDVAARKAAYFARQAEVIVVSRSFSPAFSDPEYIRKQADIAAVPDDGLAGMVDGAFLVIAALPDPVLNNRIGRACKTKGILFNNADGESGDVILPAVTGGENYTIAISTGGNSPAVSRFIRERIEEDFPLMDAMILLQDRLREELKTREPDQKKRTAILTRVLSDSAVWEALAQGQSAAWDDICRRYLHD